MVVVSTKAAHLSWGPTKTSMNDPVQDQVGAYNVRDLEALRARYRQLFATCTTLHCKIATRIRIGPT